MPLILLIKDKKKFIRTNIARHQLYFYLIQKGKDCQKSLLMEGLCVQVFAGFQHYLITQQLYCCYHMLSIKKTYVQQNVDRERN